MTNLFNAFERIVRIAGDLATKKNEAQQLTSQEQSHPFDERNIHPFISLVSLKLFDDRHYAQATFEAFKLLEKEVKKLSKIKDSGHKLMMNAFDKTKPKIKLTALSNTSEEDEQEGYRYIFAGAVSAIRNPRGHDNLVDSIDICLDHLSFASVLLRRLENTQP